MGCKVPISSIGLFSGVVNLPIIFAEMPYSLYPSPGSVLWQAKLWLSPDYVQYMYYTHSCY